MISKGWLNLHVFVYKRRLGTYVDKVINKHEIVGTWSNTTDNFSILSLEPVFPLLSCTSLTSLVISVLCLDHHQHIKSLHPLRSLVAPLPPRPLLPSTLQHHSLSPPKPPVSITTHPSLSPKTAPPPTVHWTQPLRLALPFFSSLSSITRPTNTTPFPSPSVLLQLHQLYFISIPSLTSTSY